MTNPRDPVPYLLLATALALLLPGPGAAGDWPQWGGPGGDFTVESGALAESWPEDGPRQLWRRPMGEGYSSILYRDGRLFTMYREGDEEIVVALDAATGETVWEHRETPKPWRDMTDHFGRGPNATPLLLGDRLIAVGIAGRVRTFEAASGELVWEYDLPRELGRRRRMEEYGYSGSPLPYDGKAIVLAGGNQHAVVAFDPRDGDLVWQSEPGSISYAPPAIIRLAGRD